MPNKSNPDVRPGAASPLRFSQDVRDDLKRAYELLAEGHWPPATREEIAADLLVQDHQQRDVREELEAIDAANRLLCWLYRAKSPDRAKPWQRRIALVTHTEYEPDFGPEGRRVSPYVSAPTDPGEPRRWGHRLQRRSM